MSHSCIAKYPKKIAKLPRKFKEKIIQGVFNEGKIKSDEINAKLKCENTNHWILLNKPGLLCDTSGRKKDVPTSKSDKHLKNAADPYINFLQSNERQIVSWKSNILPDLSEIMTEFTICEQMDMKVEQLIMEFTEFWTALGSNNCEEERAKNAETMRRMFAIDFDEHLARALVSIPKELMCVPNQVAAVNCMPQATISVILKRIVECDIKAEEGVKKTVAFNRSLPKELASVPPNNSTKERWMDIDAIPPELIDMSAVWEGIAHLKSSFDYFNWMKAKWNARVEPPPYLTSFYSDHSEDFEVTCNVKDLLEHFRISETMLPVLRDEEQNIDDLKKRAFEGL